MVERNKRVFISDVHISAYPVIGPGKYDYTWLQKSDAQAFSNFLNYLKNQDDVEEVVFIGDLFDNWVVPIDLTPPGFDEIISSRLEKKDPVLTALKNLCDNENLRVVCLPGNHDMELTSDIVEKYFGKGTGRTGPGIFFSGNARWNSGLSVYRSSRLRAEHGSAHAMFNAPDPINNPGSRLPLGYYISRVVATKTYNTGNGDRHWWTYVDDMLEMMGPEKFAPCVFEAVLEEADLPLDAAIVLPDRGGHKIQISARQVLARFENLYDQWKERAGAGIAFKSVLAEIGYLDDAADRLCKKNDTNIVVFGHSHDWVLDKDSWFVDDRIYANCGAWCDSPHKPYTFVEIETLRKNNERLVRVCEWENVLGTVKTLKQESVNL